MDRFRFYFVMNPNDRLRYEDGYIFASELCLPYGAVAILCAEFLKYTEQKA